MNITKVKYERLFPIGMYLNEKIGFEAELGTVDLYPVTSPSRYVEESPQAAIEKLRQLAEGTHREKYPHFYQSSNIGTPYSGIEMSAALIPETKIDSRDEQIQSHINTINSLSSKKSLMWYENLVKNANNPELTAAFESKLKSFE